MEATFEKPKFAYWAGPTARTWQFGGTSDSPIPDYRCFFVKNMSQLELGPDIDETKSAEEVEEATPRFCISEPDPSLKC